MECSETALPSLFEGQGGLGGIASAASELFCMLWFVSSGEDGGGRILQDIVGYAVLRTALITLVWPDLRHHSCFPPLQQVNTSLVLWTRHDLCSWEAGRLNFRQVLSVCCSLLFWVMPKKGPCWHVNLMKTLRQVSQATRKWLCWFPVTEDKPDI